MRLALQLTKLKLFMIDLLHPRLIQTLLLKTNQWSKHVGGSWNQKYWQEFINRHSIVDKIVTEPIWCSIIILCPKNAYNSYTTNERCLPPAITNAPTPHPMPASWEERCCYWSHELIRDTSTTHTVTVLGGYKGCWFTVSAQWHGCIMSHILYSGGAIMHSYHCVYPAITL